MEQSQAKRQYHYNTCELDHMKRRFDKIRDDMGKILFLFSQVKESIPLPEEASNNEVGH